MAVYRRPAKNQSKHKSPRHPQAGHTPPPSHRPTPLRESRRLRKRGLYLGTNTDGEPLYLAPQHIDTHIDLIGPTGSGKSRLMLWFYQVLCHTDRPIVLIDPKGSLYRMARDWSLMNGLQKRLVLFDLSGDVLPGYNPLRPTNLRIDIQIQHTREGVKSAWGADTFDSTPLLARMLYLCLYTARAMAVSMLEALDVLRPSPTLRHAAIQKISDPFVRGALVAFDSLSDRIKAEQTASTISRLEMFLCDQIVRHVICSAQSLDMEQLLDQKKIILVNFGRYQPLLPDSLKLLGRFFFNDLLGQVYRAHGEGKMDEKNPCYVLCDEIQNFATKMVCDALDEGRGIGCHMTIAHQHLAQLRSDENQSGYLYESVLTDARTKVIFPGLSPADLEVLAQIPMLKHYNPLRVKYVQRTPVFAPVETVREVRTRSKSNSYSTSRTESLSEGNSVSHSVQQSVSKGTSIGDSIAESHGEHRSTTRGTTSSRTNSRNWGVSETESGATTHSTAHTEGTAVSHGRGRAKSRSKGTTDSAARTTAFGSSEGESSTDSSTRSSAVGSSQSAGTQSAISTGEGEVVLPQEERIFKFLEKDPVVLTTSNQANSTEGRNASVGSSQLQTSSSAHADSRQRQKSTMEGLATARARSSVVSDNESESSAIARSSADTEGLSETAGWARTRQEGQGVAETEGESEARSVGTDRSTTRGNTVTKSNQVTDGTSDTLGHTVTRGTAHTAGESVEHGESVTLSPFHEYVREKIETPVFLSPEEQKLLQMQKLAAPKKRHAVLLTPAGVDCAFRTPFVPTPMIPPRRLAARLQSVYSRETFYTPLLTHEHGTGARKAITDHCPASDGSDADVIDVEAEEVRTPEPDAVLPSPTVDPETEASLWKRWLSGSNRRQEKK